MDTAVRSLRRAAATIPTPLAEEAVMLPRTVVIPACLVVLLTVGVAATQSAAPAIKSHHLINIPDSISEGDVAAALSEVNSAIAEIGYPDAGYRLWKVTGEQSGEYVYIWEGNWPSWEAYRNIHDDSAYLTAMGNNESVFGALTDDQVYNRYVEIPIGN
jgi:hypothetical protein